MLWFKKSLHCKPQSSEVHDPKANRHHKIKNNKDKSVKNCINGSSSHHDMLNHVTHDIVFDSKSGEIKCYPCFQNNEVSSSHRSTKGTKISTKSHYVDCDECFVFSKSKVTIVKESNDLFPGTTFPLATIEEHDISEHSVINLQRQDSSWQIIKKICEVNNDNSESKAILQIEHVLKVQNMQETFASFEEFRETTKINAEKLQIKHPRCLVDGNEMLRFHGTTIACSLGINGSSNPCTLDQCGLCQILRLGFSANQKFEDTIGVFTASTCGKAFDSIKSLNKPFMRKCVIVCRVIAGRINNPLQEIQEMSDSDYDSLVKSINCQLDIEELIVLNPRAVLPCFVVMYTL
ncbi:uncharacterized protein LOC123914592 [Trifolium pratense]|uniref:uncharacterized protein LOC123914592 n=1 Tax=Trifolium pratense TaxID=57577 RepID=UPI001E696163|nr:uncharacterized protein LOC123914592 [Trifolium pratense]